MVGIHRSGNIRYILCQILMFELIVNQIELLKTLFWASDQNSSTLRGRHEQEMSITSRFIEQLNAHMKPAEKLHHLPYFETAGGKKRMFTTDSFRLDTVKKIGEGQFSDTYVVDHKQITDKKFVLKRFKPECDPGIPWKELHAMVYLQHLNICQVLGAFYDDTPTIILEACFGWFYLINDGSCIN